MTHVLIDRELLERAVKADASIGASSIALVDGWKAMAQIRAILARPIQQGEAVEVVAWQDAENPLYTTAERRVMHEWANNQYPIVELMTVAQHQRILEGVRQQRDALHAEAEALREKAGKYAIIERVMKMLECDEREGGVWTACTLLLLGSAHKMNSAKSVAEQEGVTVAGEQLGNWRVTVERIDTTLSELTP